MPSLSWCPRVVQPQFPRPLLGFILLPEPRPHSSNRRKTPWRGLGFEPTLTLLDDVRHLDREVRRSRRSVYLTPGYGAAVAAEYFRGTMRLLEIKRVCDDEFEGIPQKHGSKVEWTAE